MMKIKFVASVLLFPTLFAFSQKTTEKNKERQISPNWESMASNYEVPKWFQDGKIGVWMHWGIPSAAGDDRPNDGSHYGRRMYGFTESDAPGQKKMNKNLTDWHTKTYGAPEDFGYEKLIPNFKAENFNADALVKLFKENGARFIMPVATHHDNFDLYDSFFSWNSVKMGPKIDIIKAWKDAAIKNDVKFGVSTHLYWSPRFFANARKYQKPNTPAWEFFNMDYSPTKYTSQKSWNKHWYKRCWDLIEKYDPDMFNNDSPYPSIKTGDGLGVKLFSDFLNKDLKENNGKQTTVVSFKNTRENKAAFTYNLERGMFGEVQQYPWMWATDLSGNWFYRKGAVTKMSISVLIGNAVDAISKNGVVMMNVALKGDGTLPDEQAEILKGFGSWIKVNGEGVYGTRPWKIFGEGPLKIVTKRTGENLKAYSFKDIRFTTKGGNLYAFVLANPTEDVLITTLKNNGVLVEKIKKIELLGSDEKITWIQGADGLRIKCPKNTPKQPVVGFKIILK